MIDASAGSFKYRQIDIQSAHFKPFLQPETRKYFFKNTAKDKKTIFQAALKNSSLCILIQEIPCGFISTNPLLCFYISVIPTSERSPTAGKTAAQGLHG